MLDRETEGNDFFPDTFPAPKAHRMHRAFLRRKPHAHSKRWLRESPGDKRLRRLLEQPFFRRPTVPLDRIMQEFSDVDSLDTGDEGNGVYSNGAREEPIDWESAFSKGSAGIEPVTLASFRNGSPH